MDTLIIDTPNNHQFKLTYNSKGALKKVELVKGTLSAAQWNQIGSILPPKITDLAYYKKNLQTITYTDVIKPKSTFTLFSDAWFSFYEVNKGYAPKFTAIEGKCLKDIISYLTSISGNENEALATWQVLLNRWNDLDDFHKKNTDLKYINGNLNRILDNVKRGSENKPKYSDEFRRKVAERFQSK